MNNFTFSGKALMNMSDIRIVKRGDGDFFAERNAVTGCGVNEFRALDELLNYEDVCKNLWEETTLKILHYLIKTEKWDKIQLIKMIKRISGMSLKASKNYADQIWFEREE